MIAHADANAWLEVLGQLHPMVLHFPVTLIAVLAMVEIGGLVVRRRFPRGPLLVLLWLNAVFAAVTALSGLQLAAMHGGDFDQGTLSSHQVLGVATAIACGLVAILASVFRGRAFYRWGLALAIGLLLPAGHLGSRLTHGSGFEEALERAVYGTNKTRPARDSHPTDNGNGNGGKAAAMPVAGDKVSYLQQVAPVLQQYCIGCHGEKKQKGKLRLDSSAAILKGGENGEVLAPGKPDDSVLLTNLKLPPDDDDHMPPKDHAQPKPEQIELVRKWVEQGARFDGEAPHVTPPDVPEPEQGDKSQGKEGKGEAKEDGDPGAGGETAALQALRDELVYVAPLCEGSALLRVDFAATAPKLDDQKAARLLRPLCARVGELSLARAPITDATLQVVGRMHSLQRLDLRGTRVTAKGLEHLRGLKDLKELVLAQTPLCDPVVETLLALPSLERLYLWDAGLGAGPVTRLRARPGLTVDAGEGGDAAVMESEPEVKLAKPAAAPGAKPMAAAINAVCPVSGKPVDPAITFVHEGRTVAFCCKNCLAKFQAEPGRFPVTPK